MKKIVKVGKKRTEIIPIIDANLPDDDEEDDEEYNPSKDVGDLSDEDESLASASDTGGTPSSSSRPVASTSYESEFKKPAETSISNSAVRSLDFDALEREQDQARKTRSKANLKDVTIEELDTKFVPPDITPDMYETNYNDEYTVFLAETYGKPLETDTPNEIQGLLEDDDEGSDQEWQFQEEEEILESFNADEYKFNKSTKISQKEADLLMKDIFDAYDLDQKGLQSKTKSLGNDNSLNDENGVSFKTPQAYQQYEYPQEYWPPYQMSYDERQVVGNYLFYTHCIYLDLLPSDTNQAFATILLSLKQQAFFLFFKPNK